MAPRPAERPPRTKWTLTVRLAVLIGAAALAAALWARLADAPPGGPLRIGTWNIQWLGLEHHRPPPCDRPRTPAEIKAIAAYIHEIGFHVLAVEEVAGPQQLARLAQELTEISGQPWAYYSSKDGYMLQIGLLWNKDRVRVSGAGELPLPRLLTWRDVPDLPEPFESVHVFARLPVRALVTDKATGIDVVFIALHLKSQVSNPDAPPPALVQREEVRALRGWLEQHFADPENDQDVIVAGDFNFGPKSELFEELLRGGLLLSALPEQPTPTWKSSWAIDHILVSPGARAEWGGAPLVVHNERYVLDRKGFLCGYSDHMPIALDLAGRADD